MRTFETLLVRYQIQNVKTIEIKIIYIIGTDLNPTAQNDTISQYKENPVLTENLEIDNHQNTAGKLKRHNLLYSLLYKYMGV